MGTSASERGRKSRATLHGLPAGAIIPLYPGDLVGIRNRGKGAEWARRTTCGRDSVSQHGRLDLGQSVAPGRRDVRLVREPESSSLFKYQSGKPAPARAETASGRVATEGPGTGRAYLRDRPPRDGGAPRRPHRRRSARRRAAGWRELPTGRRAAPGPPGTRRDVAPASRHRTPARQGRAEVFALVVDRRGARLADQRHVLAARGAPQGRRRDGSERPCAWRRTPRNVRYASNRYQNCGAAASDASCHMQGFAHKRAPWLCGLQVGGRSIGAQT